MNSILVIGIGKFGHHFAEKLIALGNEVMIIDEDTSGKAFASEAEKAEC